MQCNFTNRKKIPPVTELEAQFEPSLLTAIAHAPADDRVTPVQTTDVLSTNVTEYDVPHTVHDVPAVICVPVTVMAVAICTATMEGTTVEMVGVGCPTE